MYPWLIFPHKECFIFELMKKTLVKNESWKYLFTSSNSFQFDFALLHFPSASHLTVSETLTKNKAAQEPIENFWEKYINVFRSHYFHGVCFISETKKKREKKDESWDPLLSFSKIFKFPSLPHHLISMKFLFCVFDTYMHVVNESKVECYVGNKPGKSLSRTLSGSFTYVYTRGLLAVEYLAKLSRLLQIFSKSFKAMILGFDFI